MTWRPRAREAAQIAESREAFSGGGIGLYSVRLAEAPGAVIGAAGLARIGGQPEPELLYALLPACWGRGLATEAAAEVLRVAFDVLGLQTVHAGADPPNVSSFRVMERLGMAYKRTSTIGELPGGTTLPSAGCEDRIRFPDSRSPSARRNNVDVNV